METGKPLDLISAIDGYLVARESRPRERHYPSDVTSCLRKLYYKWTSAAESNPPDAGAFWKMRMGDQIHELMAEFLRQAGFEILTEVSGRKEVEGLKHVISYRIDNLFVDADHHISGIEIKSSYGRGIAEIHRSGNPRDDHLAQVCLYMALEEIPRFYLLYIGRDNGYRTQFVVDYRNGVLCANGKPFPDITFDNLVMRLAMLEKYLEDGELPHREYRVAIKNGEIKDKFQKNKVAYKTDWQCSYCSWKEKCWGDVIGIYRDGDNSEMFPESA